MISLCVITRNEAHCIEAMLRSVHGLVSEIVVVDALSTDGTPAIAAAHGAHVVSRPWSGDFAAARNASLEAATQPWILVLDADETLEPSHRDLIREIVSGPRAGVWLKRRHYSTAPASAVAFPLPPDHTARALGAETYLSTDDLRLFPNDPALRFEGAVHETIEDSVHRIGLPSIRTELLIHHFGHLASPERKKAKSLQYTDLAQRKAEERPNDWRAQLQFGIELQNLGEHHAAIAVFLRSLKLYDEFASSWRQLAVSLVAIHDYPGACEALRSALNRDSRDLLAWSLLGAVFLELSLFDEAEICFKTILSAVPQEANAALGLGQLQQKRAERAAKSD